MVTDRILAEDFVLVTGREFVLPSQLPEAAALL
jgi:hypothetical protein